MDFNDKELKVVLQALYRFRGEVSGFSQSEQNKLSLVEGVIGKIEGKVGPVTAERTRFDREMEESLAVLKTGRAGAAKAAAAAGPGSGGAKAANKAAPALDKKAASPKVKKGPAAKPPAKAAPRKSAAPAAKKTAGPAKVGAAKNKAK
ncbi:MAG TPA: hypothetical protein VMC79_06135 [Rectinemataceae bacterium]|nr:hypothetical protein [Rectinemataceae bacterium]